MGNEAISRMKALAVNLLLLLCSSIFFILFLEFVVFKYIFHAPDLAKLRYSDGIIKYAPLQKGVLLVKDEMVARFSINENGWNSAHPTYDLEKGGNPRIAVIGDSYVEAIQVDFDKSVAEQLEKKLQDKGVEVFRYGISRAPMSQYLNMLRTLIW
jgi:hypothetical protein